MNRIIHGILFDKDGTLFDFQASWAIWMEQTLELFTNGNRTHARKIGAQLGFDTELGRFLEGSPFVAGTPEVSIKVFEQEFPEKTTSEIIHLLSETSASAHQVQVVPLQPLLADLRQRNLRIGLVTNDFRKTALTHIETAGCRNEFDFVIGSDCGYNGKPDSGMLLAFCNEMQIDPSNCMMIGDSPADLIAAKRAKMIAIAVLTGVDSRETLAPLCDVLLNDIGEIPAWLDANLSPC